MFVEQLSNSIVMNDILLIILKNIGSFAFAMFGVEMTIFTVVYSFIVSKRSYFKAITHEIKTKDKASTFLISEKKFAVDYINKLRIFNKHIIILAAISLFLYFSSLFLPLFVCLDNNSIITIEHKIAASISIIYVLYTFLILAIYLISYKKEVRF